MDTLKSFLVGLGTTAAVLWLFWGLIWAIAWLGGFIGWDWFANVAAGGWIILIIIGFIALMTYWGDLIRYNK